MDSKLGTFEAFLATQSVQVPAFDFLINVGLTIVIALLLGWFYIRYAETFSNRRLFAKNFLLISLTTMFVITVVKSSLALSLGLVGALSIVRFRTAIKEPQELAYLFLSISLGLGMGADQRLITILLFVVVFILISVRARFLQTIQSKQMLLHIQTKEAMTTTVLTDVLKEYSTEVNLKRFEKSTEGIDALVYVNLDDVAKLEALDLALRKQVPHARINFLDHRM